MTSRRDFLRLGGLLAAGAVTGVAHGVEPISRKGAPVIKIGCAAQSYRKYLRDDKSMTMEGFIEAAAEMGCDGVELTSYYFPPDFGLDYVNKLKRRAFLLGLDICATSVGNNFALAPGEKRDQQIEHVKKWVEHAAEMGAPCMRVFAGDAEKDVTQEMAMSWVAQCFEACAPLAEQRGVILAMENHGALTAVAERAIAILKSVKSDCVALNLDTGNFRAPDPYGEIEKAAPYSVTTHCKTEVSPTGKPKEPADLKRIVKILRDAGYRGYFTLEYEGAEEPKIAVPRIIKAMREAL
ncbi:MAG: sugar phosphate isomerase/epimerase [Armatimonadetes bacterium]|nr:sugar phosphate isomerase/epimerase [Armatimonadota bacterium]